jgi:hypothetical protein
MGARSTKLSSLLGAGLMLGWAGCSSGDDKEPSTPDIPARGALAALSRADDCGDLLTKIQDDAIAKVKLAAELAKTEQHDADRRTSNDADEGEASDEVSAPAPARGATTGGDDPVDSPVPAKKPSRPPGEASSSERPTIDDAEPSGSASGEEAQPASITGPTGASETNAQVQGVEEADFVKVVENGAGMFLLHGSLLQKLKTYPAAQTALSGSALAIEGAPSELFVSKAGKAVVFSSAAVHSAGRGGDSTDYACPSDSDCGYGGNGTKITIADVSVDPPRVERELYYEGHYVSARRYENAASDVVRVVVQSDSRYGGLFEPNIERYDAWGRPYDAANIELQLSEWVRRTSDAIRNTTLDDWVPNTQERIGGTLTTLARACDSYYLPAPGLSDYGLTQVLALDLAQVTQPVSGITIVGATSTVYSNPQRLVLAQPDYRWGSRDLGFIDTQRTALHVFDLTTASTAYVASGWVTGQLPPFNPQFGIDVGRDGTLRVATTGSVRDKPEAKRDDPDFWSAHPETYVSLVQVNGNTLEQVGRTGNLGKPNESIRSARFVGDRAYVVTYEQKDPLVVVDVANPRSPAVLGQISIPGFSQYMHPLDDDHLITVGQSEAGGIQLQLFDVSNPAAGIPAPKVHDFLAGSGSEASYTHKAFTFYDGVLALPVTGYSSSPSYARRYFSSTLQLLRVSAATGFTELGAVDHTSLYADNGAGVRCGVCAVEGCYDYACGYEPTLRRGHFVRADDTTYVYSFSNAGVLVNDLANLTTPVAKLGLPQPTYGGAIGGGRKPASRPGFATDEVGEAGEDTRDPIDTTEPAETPSAAPTRDAGALVLDAAAPAHDAGVPEQAAAPSPVDATTPAPSSAP